MYYKKYFTKQDELIKKEILYDFMILERYHRTIRGEIRMISLHAKYDFDKERELYYIEDFFMYLNVDEETKDVKEFVNRYGFSQTDDFPKEELKHLLGNYGVTVKAIDGFIP